MFKLGLLMLSDVSLSCVSWALRSYTALAGFEINECGF